MKSIYLIGSLRNPKVVKFGNALRKLGFEVFEDWWAAGKIADDSWKMYEEKRGRTYPQALKGFAACHVFEFDKKHLDRADLAVLLLPAGRSGHLELGYFLGRGKKGYVLIDRNPSRWDVMLKFATGVFFSQKELFAELKKELNDFSN